jgi:RimJ/RimL family protein N-acetyltransferase
MTPDLQPTLVGEFVTLRPLQPEDFDALYAVARDPLIWEQHPARDRWQHDVFRRFVDDALACRGAFVVVDRASGAIVGSTRYFGHDPLAREIEIGWTFLARSHWGGRHNAEMKRLMLAHAFTFVDTVVFHVGRDNVRSQKAVERIGGVVLASGVRAGADHLVYALTRATCTLALGLPGAGAGAPGTAGASDVSDGNA